MSWQTSKLNTAPTQRCLHIKMDAAAVEDLIIAIGILVVHSLHSSIILLPLLFHRLYSFQVQGLLHSPPFVAPFQQTFQNQCDTRWMFLHGLGGYNKVDN